MTAEGSTGAPLRIQRKRTKGWRMPEGAVYVGRPSRWGNPFKVGDRHPYTNVPMDAAHAVAMFDTLYGPSGPFPWALEVVQREYMRSSLAGRDLACWCPLDQPCHADLLIRWANG